MSKNIVIQEGGIGKQLTVDKLKTNLVGGVTCLWVPEDERSLGTKHISENGTYKASDDGYYGYSEVTVSGVGEVTGKAPDGSGDDATATVDPETGEIVITKAPYSISVTTPPSKTSYVDGESINTSGMVVKAFLKNGSAWSDASHPGGIIPLSELSINPTVASVSDTQTKELDGKTVSYVGQRGLTRPWYGTPTGKLQFTSDGRAVEMWNGSKYVFSTFSKYLYTITPDDPTKEPIYGENVYRFNTVVDGGQTVYYSDENAIEQSLPHTDLTDVREVANILFGANSRSVGGDMPISVNWSYGEKSFETSFTVEVHDRLDGGE